VQLESATHPEVGNGVGAVPATLERTFGGACRLAPLEPFVVSGEFGTSVARCPLQPLAIADTTTNIARNIALKRRRDIPLLAHGNARRVGYFLR
jgi:hypothetical protein